MERYLCIGKSTNSSGETTHYRLMDENNRVYDVEKARLKDKMRNGVIDVLNLKLDTQGRIIKRKTKNNFTSTENTSSVENTGTLLSAEETKGKTEDNLLKSMIEALSIDSKDREELLIKMVKELYLMNDELMLRVNELQAKVDISSMSSSDKIVNALEQINASYESIEDLKKDISNIAKSLKDLDKSTEETYKCPIHADGIWEEPEDEYERNIRRDYYSNDINKLCTAKTEKEFQSLLSNIANEIEEMGYDYNIPFDIPANIIVDLRKAMDRKAKAYYLAKQYFVNQLEDYQSALNTTKLLAFVDNCKEVTYNVGESDITHPLANVDIARQAPGVLSEMGVAMGRTLPFKGIVKVADKADYKQKYKSKKTTTADKFRLAGTSECIWNTYKKVWENDPDYDIKSYCIQSLGQLYLGSFLMTMKDNMLTGIHNYYKENIFGFKVKKADVATEIYECAIAAYFASLEVVEKHYYKGNKNLARDFALPGNNGRIIALMRIAMLMCNIRPEITEQYVGLVITKMQKKDGVRVHLDINLAPRKD